MYMHIIHIYIYIYIYIGGGPSTLFITTHTRRYYSYYGILLCITV